MSMKLMVQVFDLDFENPVRKLIMLKLADNADDNGQCFPSMKHIADKCNCSKRSVATHLKWLENNGFLSVVRRKKQGSKESQSNIYTLKLGSENASLGSAGDALGGSAGDAQESVTLSNQSNNRWDYSAVITSWNELDLPNISLISSSREKALNARYKDLITVRQDLKEMPKHEAMQQLFSYVSESDFLMGRSTGFKISFDWLMKPTNFVKVMEGNYND